MNHAVDLSGAHPLFDIGRNAVQHGHIDLTGLADGRDLLRRLYHLPGRHHVPLIGNHTYSLVECLVAVLIFFVAAAPAEIIPL